MVEGFDPLEWELAQAIVAVVEEASGLEARVGIADGKFAAYVAARVLLRTAEHVGRALASPLPGSAHVELVLAPAPATPPVRVAAASRESRAPPRVATV